MINSKSNDPSLEEFFVAKGPACEWTNNRGIRVTTLVNWKDPARVDKAIEQAELSPVPMKEVISYVNEFFDRVSGVPKSGTTDSITLDDKERQIIGRTILVDGFNWKPFYYNKRNPYKSSYDPNYDFIRDEFQTGSEKNLLWIKFTSLGHVGVVCDSNDINLSYNNSSGSLLRATNFDATWSDTVLIVPLTSDVMPNPWLSSRRKELETGLGNFLISKGVPIIDYYSHNNF